MHSREKQVMDSPGSISCLLDQARQGCEWAAARLWERYQPQLLAIARRKLEGSSRGVADEEDVVVTAFQSFLRRTRGGNYPDLQGRFQLWSLLVTITVHKALNQIRDQNRQRRAAPTSPTILNDLSTMNLAELVSSQPGPDSLVMISDSLDSLLAQLNDPELRNIAVAKLNGFTNREIADAVGRSLATIERRLTLIRDKWRAEVES